jgi:hypothetical protein
MSYPQVYGEYSGFRDKLKKVFKPVTKVVQKVTSKGPLKTVKKVLRKGAVIQAGIVTGGFVKGKALGIKSKSSTKLFKTTAKITRVVAAVALAVVAAPIVAPYLASAGSATIGALKFVGGKLVSAPKAFLSMLTGKGKNPATMSPEEIVKEGVESGTVTAGMLEQLGPMIPGLIDTINKPAYPGGVDFPARPDDPNTPQDESQRPVEAGIFGGDYTIPLILGGGIVLFLVFGRAKGRS